MDRHILRFIWIALVLSYVLPAHGQAPSTAHYQVYCPAAIPAAGAGTCLVIALDVTSNLDLASTVPLRISIAPSSDAVAVPAQVTLENGVGEFTIGFPSSPPLQPETVSVSGAGGPTDSKAVVEGAAPTTDAAMQFICPANIATDTAAQCIALILEGGSLSDNNEAISVSANLAGPGVSLVPSQIKFSHGTARIPVSFSGAQAHESATVTLTSGKLKQSANLLIAAAMASPPGAAGLALKCPPSVVVNDIFTCSVTSSSGADPLFSGSLALATSDDAGSLLAPTTIKVQQGKASFTAIITSFPPTSPDGVVETFTISPPGATVQKAIITVLPSGDFSGGEIMRLVGGGTASFAPSTSPKAKLFADMYLEWGLGSAPTSNGADPLHDFGARTRYWVQASLLSTTEAATSTNIGAFAAVASGATTAGLSGVADAKSIESFAMRTGLSWRLGGTSAELGGIPHGTSNTLIHFIAGIGFTTPTVPSPTPVTSVYCLTPASPATTCAMLTGAPAPTTEDKYLVVNPPIRTSYFTNWEMGFRLQTFYAGRTDSHQPAVTDITLGQDQAVTGGQFRKPVFHYEGFWPIPGEADFLFLIFSGSVRMGSNSAGFAPLPLNATPIATAGYSGPLTGPNFVQTSGAILSADSFRIGIAADLVDLVKHHLFASAAAAQNP